MARAFKRDFGLPIIFAGKTIHFEPVSRSTGVILLDDNDPRVAELDRLANARQKGVVRISAEVREALIQKKTLPPPRPDNGLFGSVRAFNREQVLPAKASSPASVAPSPVSPAVAALKPAPKPGEPVTLRPSAALVEMLKAQGKPIPPPVTVKAPEARPSPKDKANRILKTELPKPHEQNAPAADWDSHGSSIGLPSRLVKVESPQSEK